MGKLIIPNFLGALMVAAIAFGIYKYDINEREEFRQLHLNEAIDLAGKSSIKMLLDSRDLNVDYEDYTYMESDPSKALEAFVDTFLLNYNVSLSEENRQLVKLNYMPTFVVAMSDGYYIAKQEVVKKDSGGEDFDLVFSLKRPYTYKNPNPSDNRVYGLMLGGEYYYVIDGSDSYRKKGQPPGIKDKNDVLKHINTLVSQDMKNVIDSYQEKTQQGWQSNFYIPTDLTTLSGVNRIDGPTVITLLQNVDLNGTKGLDAHSVSGTKIELSRMIVGYIRDGVRMYCYEDTAPGGISIIDTFTKVEDAAKAGFMADIQYLQK